MFKAALFDLDGLLIDSEPYWKKADTALLDEFGLKFEERHSQYLKGMGIKEIAAYMIKEFNLNETVDSLTEKRHKKLYELLLKNLKLMPYVNELLDKLKSKGLVMVVATAGHTQQKAEEILRKLEIRQYFSKVISGMDIMHSKPAPDIYLLTAKELGFQPSECIVLEDTPNGILAGKAAGMSVIGVNPEEKIRERYEEVKPDYIFNNLEIPIEVFLNG